MHKCVMKTYVRTYLRVWIIYLTVVSEFSVKFPSITTNELGRVVNEASRTPLNDSGKWIVPPDTVSATLESIDEVTVRVPNV